MKLKWGIVGLGNIAHQFAKDLLLLDHTTLYAAASRSNEKAKHFADTYGIQQYYGSYEELINDPEVDIVYIATPHDSHAHWCIAAMNAGKHILCEKPLAVNAKQVQDIMRSAQENKVFAMEAFWSRFNPSILACLDHIADGTIGKVNYLQADFTFYREDEAHSRMLNLDLAGGSLLEMGVYPVFLAYIIFGKPDEILATGRFHHSGADIQTAAILKYKNGIATIMSGFVSQSDMVAKIYGTKGRLYIHPYWHETQGYTLIKGNHDGKMTNFGFPTNGKGFTYEIEECIQCISNNDLESPRWRLQDSFEILSITDEIRRQIGLQYPFE